MNEAIVMKAVVILANLDCYNAIIILALVTGSVLQTRSSPTLNEYLCEYYI